MFSLRGRFFFFFEWYSFFFFPIPFCVCRVYFPSFWLFVSCGVGCAFFFGFWCACIVSLKYVIPFRMCFVFFWWALVCGFAFFFSGLRLFGQLSLMSGSAASVVPEPPLFSHFLGSCQPCWGVFFFWCAFFVFCLLFVFQTMNLGVMAG